VSDQGWQNAVLRDLGVPPSGLVTPANPTGSAASPGAAAQPRQVYAPQAAPADGYAPHAPPADEPVPQAAPVDGYAPQAAPESYAPPASPENAFPEEPDSSEHNPEGAHPVISSPLSAPVSSEPLQNGSQPPYYLQEPTAAPDQPAPDQPAPDQPVPHQSSAPPDQPAPDQPVPDRPAASPGQEYPDLVHPDLVFPDVGQSSLGPTSPPVQHPDQQHAGPGQWDQAAQQAPPPQAPPGHVPPQPPPPSPPQSPAYAEGLLHKRAHGDPLMRRMGRGISKAVGASAAQDVRENADLAGRIRLPISTCRRIAVTSIRGGAGKTTVAGLTATMLMQVRQDRILAADADSGLGSLPLRMGVQTDLSLQDLARSRPRSWDEASRFLAHSADGLWVLSNTSRGRIGAELEIDTFRTATGELSRYFSAMVIDCGAGLLPELQRGILAEAHAHVLVTPATVDGALSARGALDWMAGNGFAALLPRTIVTLVTHTPHEDADLERARQMLSAGGMTVVHMPYDRHLASGTPIDLGLAGEATQSATTRIAAEMFGRAALV
jgi:MinD-like ATPase involved in chromosome partitioning or flagellar assembly